MEDNNELTSNVASINLVPALINGSYLNNSGNVPGIINIPTSSSLVELSNSNQKWVDGIQLLVNGYFATPLPVDYINVYSDERTIGEKRNTINIDNVVDNAWVVNPLDPETLTRPEFTLDLNEIYIVVATSRMFEDGLANQAFVVKLFSNNTGKPLTIEVNLDDEFGNNSYSVAAYNVTDKFNVDYNPEVEGDSVDKGLFIRFKSITIGGNAKNLIGFDSTALLIGVNDESYQSSLDSQSGKFVFDDTATFDKLRLPLFSFNTTSLIDSSNRNVLLNNIKLDNLVKAVKK